MFNQLRAAIMVFFALSIITGIVYPLAITGIAQTLFPRKANGSLILDHDAIVGSELIGQTFDEPKYFWSRPSAISYNAAVSGGSNLGPTNPGVEAVKNRVEKLKKAILNTRHPFLWIWLLPAAVA